jgi:hypothetical protein
MAVLGRTALLTLLALAMASTPSNAQTPPAELHEARLDIDNDGVMDRAVLVRDRADADLDLYIFSGLGEAKLDLSRRPTFLKKGLATDRVLAFEGKDEGSLIVNTGCGGCSNDTSTTLTIVQRSGDLLVAGVTYDWDTRNGSGTCDINFLTGKGTLSRNMAKARPVRGRFAPIRLADWSQEKRPKACL